MWGGATVALFLISLVGSSPRVGGWEGLEGQPWTWAHLVQVPYSYMEPGTHGRLWVGTHRLFGAVEHLQLANSYGLFRRMTGLGGRPEVVLEGSYDGHHWTVSLLWAHVVMPAPDIAGGVGVLGQISLAQLILSPTRSPRAGNRVHVQTWEHEPATPHCGPSPATPGLADVVRCPGPPHA